MGIKDELNNNNVTSAYKNVKNSSVLHNANNISTKNIAISSTYSSKNTTSPASTTKAKQAGQSFSTMVKAVALVASAAIVGAVGITTMSVPPPTISVNEMFLSADETGVYYFVGLSDFSDDITIVLQNDFTNRVDKIEEQSWEGGFENLASNMKYTFLVKQGSQVIAREIIITRPGEEKHFSIYEEEPEKEDYNGRDPTTGDDNPTNGDYSGEGNSNNGSNYGNDGTTNGGN